MKQVIAIGGEPASGKTTVVKKIVETLGRERFEDWKFYKGGTLRGLINFDMRLLIFGVYEEGEMFSGTDRLSMAVMKAARNILGDDLPGYTVLFEGDRLFNLPFLTHCASLAPTTAYVIRASDNELARRHAIRGDTQSSVWLRGRKTKISNIQKSFRTIERNNETSDDSLNIAIEILKKI